jgi:tetratricopeptide (TPR) repeat protein
VVERFEDAITAHEQARDIFRATRDRHDEGRAWNNLGLALQDARRFDEAINAHKQARDSYRGARGQRSEGQAARVRLWLADLDG